MDLLPPHRSPPLAPPPPLLHRDHLEADVKPQKVEPSEMPSVLKREPDADPAPRPLAALRLSCNPKLPGRDEPPLLSHRVSSPPPPPPLQHQRAERREEVRRDKEEEQEEDGQVIKVEASSYPVPLLLSEAKPELVRDPEGYPACTSAAPPSPPESTPACPPQERACNLKTRPDSPTDLPLEVAAETPERPPRTSSSSSSSSSSPPPLAISSEDPMAGLLALATASEMVAARAATPPAPTLLPQVEDPSTGPDYSATGALEKVALEGMALLSQMAQQELENMRQERGE